METNNFNYVRSESETQAVSKTFLASVFSWMFAALAITAVLAFYFGINPDLQSILQRTDELGKIHATGLGFIIMLSPLAFILVISFGFQRLSYPALLFIFLLFSAVMGMSLSSIFLVYKLGSIVSTLAAASGMFGLMAVVGYTTKTDLTKFGSIMMMGLFGIVIASLINMFVGSSGMQYLISCLGVLVFTGLTAYDVQKLKNIGAGVDLGEASTSKLVIMGALNLYMDFINLFLMLLNLFGDRK